MLQIQDQAIGSPKGAPSEAELVIAFRREPHGLLDVGHAKVAHWRYGRGPDLLFVHGWPLDGATFRRVIPLLADAFTCHVIDLPGAGQTEVREASAVDFREHAETLRRVVDALSLERYAYFAHDSGGFAARIAAAGDARVAGLVLGNTEIPGHTPWLVAAYALLCKTRFGIEAMRAALANGVIRRSALGLGGCFEDPRYADGDFFGLFVEPLLSGAADGQMRLMQNLHQDTLAGLAAAHARITAPVQLVWGSRDPFFPIAGARRMLPQFGGPAELGEIPPAKLFAHEDHPAAFVAHARPFLQACFGAGSAT